MRIGIPAEIKTDETRVALEPSAVRQLVASGHVVLVQTGSGCRAGHGDAAFQRAGSVLVAQAEDLWREAQLVVKVKEPVGPELDWLRPDLVVFSYLHLAAAPECRAALVTSKSTAIGFETVQLDDGTLPLLAPMSAAAGRLAVQIGADLLTAPRGGRGVLLGKLPAATGATAVIIGAGIAGRHALSVAVGMGANATVVDTRSDRLAEVSELYGARVSTLPADDRHAVQFAIAGADLVVCAALVPGARAPVVVTAQSLASMLEGSVLVDIAIDQGGNCSESVPTSFEAPTRIRSGVLVCAIPNLPAAVPRSATAALSAVIAPFVRALADRGWQSATAENAALARGLNVAAGQVVHPALT